MKKKSKWEWNWVSNVNDFHFHILLMNKSITIDYVNKHNWH